MLGNKKLHIIVEGKSDKVFLNYLLEGNYPKEKDAIEIEVLNGYGNLNYAFVNNIKAKAAIILDKDCEYDSKIQSVKAEIDKKKSDVKWYFIEPNLEGFLLKYPKDKASYKKWEKCMEAYIKCSNSDLDYKYKFYAYLRYIKISVKNKERFKNFSIGEGGK